MSRIGETEKLRDVAVLHEKSLERSIVEVGDQQRCELQRMRLECKSVPAGPQDMRQVGVGNLSLLIRVMEGCFDAAGIRRIARVVEGIIDWGHGAVGA